MKPTGTGMMPALTTSSSAASEPASVSASTVSAAVMATRT